MSTQSVGDLMNPDVVCLAPDTTVREAEALFGERNISGAPVVDPAGRPVGVVSQHDLVRHQAERVTAGGTGRFYSDVEEYRDLASAPVDVSRTPVSRLMSRELLTVERDAPAADAARRMRERGVHRLLVVHESALVGIVSSLDLLAVVAETG